MPGRKPLPSNIVEMRGNPSKRPIRKHLKPPVAIPECPAQLTPAARAKWDELSRELLNLGMLHEIDSTALAMISESWARWVEAEQQVSKYGLVIKGKDGGWVTNPFARAARQERLFLIRALPEFGMTPSSRMRIPPKETSEQESEASAFFA